MPEIYVVVDKCESRWSCHMTMLDQKKQTLEYLEHSFVPVVSYQEKDDQLFHQRLKQVRSWSAACRRADENRRKREARREEKFQKSLQKTGIFAGRGAGGPRSASFATRRGSPPLALQAPRTAPNLSSNVAGVEDFSTTRTPREDSYKNTTGRRVVATAREDLETSICTSESRRPVDEGPGTRAGVNEQKEIDDHQPAVSTLQPPPPSFPSSSPYIADSVLKLLPRSNPELELPKRSSPFIIPPSLSPAGESNSTASTLIALLGRLQQASTKDSDCVSTAGAVGDSGPSGATTSDILGTIPEWCRQTSTGTALTSSSEDTSTTSSSSASSNGALLHDFGLGFCSEASPGSSGTLQVEQQLDRSGKIGNGASSPSSRSIFRSNDYPEQLSATSASRSDRSSVVQKGIVDLDEVAGCSTLAGHEGAAWQDAKLLDFRASSMWTSFKTSRAERDTYDAARPVIAKNFTELAGDAILAPNKLSACSKNVANAAAMLERKNRSGQPALRRAKTLPNHEIGASGVPATPRRDNNDLRQAPATSATTAGSTTSSTDHCNNKLSPFIMPQVPSLRDAMLACVHTSRGRKSENEDSEEDKPKYRIRPVAMTARAAPFSQYTSEDKIAPRGQRFIQKQDPDWKRQAASRRANRPGGTSWTSKPQRKKHDRPLDGHPLRKACEPFLDPSSFYGPEPPRLENRLSQNYFCTDPKEIWIEYDSPSPSVEKSFALPPPSNAGSPLLASAFAWSASTSSAVEQQKASSAQTTTYKSSPPATLVSWLGGRTNAIDSGTGSTSPTAPASSPELQHIKAGASSSPLGSYLSASKNENPDPQHVKKKTFPVEKTLDEGRTIRVWASRPCSQRFFEQLRRARKMQPVEVHPGVVQSAKLSKLRISSSTTNDIPASMASVTITTTTGAPLTTTKTTLAPASNRSLSSAPEDSTVVAPLLLTSTTPAPGGPNKESQSQVEEHQAAAVHSAGVDQEAPRIPGACNNLSLSLTASSMVTRKQHTDNANTTSSSVAALTEEQKPSASPASNVVSFGLRMEAGSPLHTFSDSPQGEKAESSEFLLRPRRSRRIRLQVAQLRLDAASDDEGPRAVGTTPLAEDYNSASGGPPEELLRQPGTAPAAMSCGREGGLRLLEDGMENLRICAPQEGAGGSSATTRSAGTCGNFDPADSAPRTLATAPASAYNALAGAPPTGAGNISANSISRGHSPLGTWSEPPSSHGSPDFQGMCPHSDVSTRCSPEQTAKELRDDHSLIDEEDLEDALAGTERVQSQMQARKAIEDRVLATEVIKALVAHAAKSTRSANHGQLDVADADESQLEPPMKNSTVVACSTCSPPLGERESRTWNGLGTNSSEAPANPAASPGNQRTSTDIGVMAPMMTTDTTTQDAASSKNASTYCCATTSDPPTWDWLHKTRRPRFQNRTAFTAEAPFSRPAHDMQDVTTSATNVVGTSPQVEDLLGTRGGGGEGESAPKAAPALSYEGSPSQPFMSPAPARVSVSPFLSAHSSPLGSTMSEMLPVVVPTPPTPASASMLERPLGQLQPSSPSSELEAPSATGGAFASLFAAVPRAFGRTTPEQAIRENGASPSTGGEALRPSSKKREEKSSSALGDQTTPASPEKISDPKSFASSATTTRATHPHDPAQSRAHRQQKLPRRIVTPYVRQIDPDVLSGADQCGAQPPASPSPSKAGTGATKETRESYAANTSGSGENEISKAQQKAALSSDSEEKTRSIDYEMVMERVFCPAGEYFLEPLPVDTSGADQSMKHDAGVAEGEQRPADAGDNSNDAAWSHEQPQVLDTENDFTATLSQLRPEAPFESQAQRAARFGSDFRKFVLLEGTGPAEFRLNIDKDLFHPAAIVLLDEHRGRVPNLVSVAHFTACRCLGFERLRCFLVPKELVDPRRYPTVLTYGTSTMSHSPSLPVPSSGSVFSTQTSSSQHEPTVLPNGQLKSASAESFRQALDLQMQAIRKSGGQRVKGLPMPPRALSEQEHRVCETILVILPRLIDSAGPSFQVEKYWHALCLVVLRGADVGFWMLPRKD
ncbi:unnamed protein product [Amoebophrya sp. A120]|nr:unnamed protein product [Amoebophrya sp. A120]|eukprot:GSA120T00018412001.1